MAFLLAFGGVSKEYLHLFTGHTDTESCDHHREGLYFESEHHHCDFLSYTLADYTPDAIVYSFATAPVAFPVYSNGHKSRLIPSEVSSSHLRGPPAVAA